MRYLTIASEVRRLTAAGLVVFFLATGCAKAGADERRPLAPDFQLTDLQGRPLQLSSYKGKVVLLNFWATWCPPCLEEIPHFKALHSTYKDKGLEIIGISLDETGEGPVKAFAKAHGISYPVAMGSVRLTQDYGGIRAIPTTFLVDKKGRIAKKYLGSRQKQVFEQEILSLLSEP